jgi:hypothetical protein
MKIPSLRREEPHKIERPRRDKRNSGTAGAIALTAKHVNLRAQCLLTARTGTSPPTA